RESIDGDDNLQAPKACPLAGNRPHGAGDQLCVDIARGQCRENGVELAISDERLAANDGHVKRFLRVDEAYESLDELVAAVIREAAQCDIAAKGRVTERVAAWAPQRALARDLDRQVGLPSSQDAAPCLHDAAEDV